MTPIFLLLYVIVDNCVLVISIFVTLIVLYPRVKVTTRLSPVLVFNRFTDLLVGEALGHPLFGRKSPLLPRHTLSPPLLILEHYLLERMR